MLKIAAIIVLYNENYDDSIANITLNKKGIDTYLFDNSTKEEYINHNKGHIYQSGDNIGLSRAYNKVIAEIKDQYDFIIISDSDTHYKEEYLISINNLDLSINVALPDIIDKETNRVLWPQKHSLKIFTLLRREKSGLKHGYFYSINSGIVYNTKIFDRVKFNEGLWIDCVDFEMFDQLKKNQIEQTVLGVSIDQDFSTHNEDAWISGRVKYTYKDLIKYYGKIWYLAALVKYILLTMQYRNTKYLKAYFKIYIKRS